MSRSLLFLLACLPFLMTTPGWAQTCVRPAEVPTHPQIDVIPLMAPVQYDFSRDGAALAQMGPGKSVGYGALDHIRGLTSAQLTYGLKTEFLISPQPKGGVCLWPKAIRVQIGYDSMIVYIDQKYRQGSCQHTAILSHEREHVKINQNTLQRYHAWIADQFHSHVERSYPSFAATAAQAREQSLQAMSAELRKLIDIMEKERDFQHKALDRPESYAYTQRQCVSW